MTKSERLIYSQFKRSIIEKNNDIIRGEFRKRIRNGIIRKIKKKMKEKREKLKEFQENMKAFKRNIRTVKRIKTKTC